jgi:hypothetical protein
MQSIVNAQAIRKRLLALLAASHLERLDEAARRLGVSEGALAESLDAKHPSQSIEILTAFVDFAGVDPTWLVTGEYDLRTHRDVLADDGEYMRLVLRRLMGGRQTPAPPTIQKLDYRQRRAG